MGHSILWPLCSLIFSHPVMYSILPCPSLLWSLSGPYNQQKLYHFSNLNFKHFLTYFLSFLLFFPSYFLHGYLLYHEPLASWTSWRPLIPWPHSFSTFYQHLPSFLSFCASLDSVVYDYNSFTNTVSSFAPLSLHWTCQTLLLDF